MTRLYLPRNLFFSPTNIVTSIYMWENVRIVIYACVKYREVWVLPKIYQLLARITSLDINCCQHDCTRRLAGIWII